MKLIIKKILLLKKLIIFEFLKSLFLMPLINEKIKKPLNIKEKIKLNCLYNQPYLFT